ncbi:glycoside hydrolase family 32 protein [Pedobacter endophyticus]|uniref:Glycoside hydrolase family 32 protein n=1 Tax=Pedobacter endophyticus TaxID=2789740 RepID=A0A7S9KZ96_9SPHI|nr:glycoside hydrolase family 32 protein [Pedobacter endophyticus]QPH39334.1 glycoside hydrolase family 32 protein [Pedobacter endophyticus]
MKTSPKILLALTAFLCLIHTADAADIVIKINKRYLNLPVSQKQDRKNMTFEIAGKQERVFKIRLATSEPEYWVFCDVTALKGKTIKISYDGDASGLDKIYQNDEIAGHELMYKEKNRPQFHFTSKRGWINDPNGLIYYEGEYHLFYQHNPYEKEWENMSWGHAVSKDMIHWEELPTALSPDNIGTMFSGSAVIDYHNTAGFNKGNTPAMVATYTAYTDQKQVQCVAYSLDKGRTWTKYSKNPIIDSKAKWNSNDTRDPRVFWYEPGNHWVLVLNERDGHSIYNSKNLKDWTFESHTTGFWECPDLFELPVDGDKNKTRWVMYGASNTYMLGSFDGKRFTPQSGKHFYVTGTIYAAQTFTNIPESDGRRIQIGWGRISHPEMPFNGMMLLPTELKLKTTRNGVRLVSETIKEADQLFQSVGEWNSLSAKDANEKLKAYNGNDRIRIKTKLKLSHATSAGLNLFGQKLLDYDMNFNLVNGVFYSPEDMTSMEISADIYIDRTSVEVFIDNGAYSYSLERKPDAKSTEGFQFWGNNVEIKDLKVYSVKSIW